MVAIIKEIVEADMNGETEYLKILKNVRENGVWKENRTGIRALTIPHQMLQHDMSEGFPLFTIKNVPFKLIRVELEFFIKGLTDKSWLQERGCEIWSEWACPFDVDDYMERTGETDRKKAQLEVKNLGPIYGAQWRNFNYGAVEGSSVVNDGSQDQLATIVNKLKTDPNDRRMVCTALDPLEVSSQALPPCHYAWQVTHINGTLHLNYTMRSSDMALGQPFNISQYALLLHLLCKETGFKEGLVTGFLSDVHIYENCIDGVDEMLSRKPYELPTIETPEFTSIFDWEYTHTKSVGYKKHPTIKMEVAV